MNSPIDVNKRIRRENRQRGGGVLRAARLGMWLASACVVVIPAGNSDAKPLLNGLTALSTLEQGSSTVVRIQCTGKPLYSVFKLERPERLSIDFTDAEAGSRLPEVEDVNTWAVSQLAVMGFKTEGSKTARVMINFRRPADYRVTTSGNTVLVTISPKDAKLDAKPTDMKPSLAQQPMQLAKQERAVLRDIRFVDKADHSRIELDVQGNAAYQLGRSGRDWTLTFTETRLPTLLQRTMDTTAFEGPIREVSSYQPQGETGVRVRVVTEGVPQNEVVREGNTLVWKFTKNKTLAERMRDSVGAAGGDPSTASEPKAISFGYESTPVAAAGGSDGKGKRYTGRRINLDFKDADIHNILRLISDVGGINIITTEAVSGTITIRMNDVPWDHALDVILRTKGFGQVREGNLIRVAPLAALEKEREAELARQKQMVLLQPLETRLIPLSYAQANMLLPKLQYTLSPRGKVTYDERTNMVIARDVSGNLDLLEQMIRNLDTQTPQVLIEARVIEARTSYSKSLGIQWGGNFAASPATGNSTGLVFPNQFGVGGGNDDRNQPSGGILLGQAANPNFIVNMPAATGLNSGGALGMTFGSVSGNFNLNLRLSAAESTGDIRIISAPRITTLDNVQAQIEQGVTIPFSQVSANGVQTTFKDAKLALMVKPHVTAEGSIIMLIQVERSEPDFANTGAGNNPTILRKEAKTELLVKDGETAVIGGIYSTRDGRSWNKVPWIADVPIIGYLFKSRRDTSDREEVLVFITPRIINRAKSIGQ